jgi:Insect pheromone-binding family, A10/OS-D
VQKVCAHILPTSQRNCTYLKMKLEAIYPIFALILSDLTFLATSQGNEKTFYSSRYDIINTETILKSPRLLNNLCDCLLDKKNCSPEGTDIKSNLKNLIFFYLQKLFFQVYTKALNSYDFIKISVSLA